MATETLKSSTNWIVAGGSLPDSISFETSDDDASSSPSSKGVLLARPPSADFLPCEITVYFRQQHEIHRVYVQSSARTYEIYYALNDNKEYLCTVRCSEVSNDDPHLTRTDGSAVENQSGNCDTAERQKSLYHVDSNKSNEDGWIEVGLPNNIQTNEEDMILYEATAEISDANPCESITIRFLSLQEKSCVYVSEVYILADPVEVSKVDTLGGMRDSLGGSSLLAMFVPQLLQLSKSGRKETQDRSYYDSSGISGKAPGGGSLDVKKTVAQEMHSFGMANGEDVEQEKVQLATENPKLAHTLSFNDKSLSHTCLNSRFLEVQNELQKQPELSGISQRSSGEGVYSSSLHQQTTSEQTTTHLHSIQPNCIHSVASDNMSEFTKEQHGLSVNRIESLLDDLISRVHRIEGFCSRFEENMLKPLDCIDKRLQKLEQQFDSFSVGSNFHKPCCCPKPLASECSLTEPDKGTIVRRESQVMLSEETLCQDPSIEADNDLVHQFDSNMCSGLVVKAPEFCGIDNEYVKPDDMVVYNTDCNECDDTVDSSTKNTCEIDTIVDSNAKEHIEGKKKISIDYALASALAAFMSTKPVNETKAAAFKLSSSNISESDPSEVSSSGASLLVKCGLEKNCHSLPELVNEVTACDGSPLSPVTTLDSTINSKSENNVLDTTLSFVASDFADDFKPSVSFPQMVSGMAVVAPEFLSDENDLIGFDETSKSNGESCYDAEALTSSLDVPESSLPVQLESSVYDKTLVLAADEACNHDADLLTGIITSEGEGVENHGNKENDDSNFYPDSGCLSHVNKQNSLMEGILAGSDVQLSGNASQEDVSFFDIPVVANATIDDLFMPNNNGSLVVGEDDHDGNERKVGVLLHDKKIENALDGYFDGNQNLVDYNSKTKVSGGAKEIEWINWTDDDIMAGYFTASVNKPCGQSSDNFGRNQGSDQYNVQQDHVFIYAEKPSEDDKHNSSGNSVPTLSLGGPAFDTTSDGGCVSEPSLQFLLYETCSDVNQDSELEGRLANVIVQQECSIPSKSIDSCQPLVDLDNISLSNETSVLHHDDTSQDAEYSNGSVFSSLI